MAGRGERVGGSGHRGIGESENRRVNPGVESAKSLFFGVDWGEGWPRLRAAITGIAEIAEIARDRKTKTLRLVTEETDQEKLTSRGRLCYTILVQHASVGLKFQAALLAISQHVS